MNSLVQCYKRQAKGAVNANWLAVMMEALPPSLSQAEAELLLQRLTRKYRFFPSIAEVCEEWKALRREQKTAAAPAAACFRPPQKGHMPGHIRKTLADIQAGHPLPEQPLPQDIIDFARDWFPDLPEPLIRANQTALSGCMRDREKEAAAGCDWMTVMELGSDGSIELLMRRRGQGRPDS